MSDEYSLQPYALTELPEIQARVDRLERQLRRQRLARQEAERISERATRELYDKQQGLVLLETVATAANEATGIEPAIATSLEAIRAHASWRLGHLWLRDRADEMVSTDVWAGDTDRHAPFCEASRGLRFGPGVGLPGRVLKDGRAVWMSDPAGLMSLPRDDAMRAAQLRTALCFPLLAGPDVVGALEFFADSVLEPDLELLALMSQAGTQLGRVVERQRAAEALVHQATHDALTGLPNRVLILDLLKRSLARQSRADGERTAVFFVDLDGFKAINDTLGHAAGDRLLSEVAARLSRVIRCEDTLGRLGGDEFVIVCEALTDEYPVVMIADRLGVSLREPFTLDGEQFLVSASIGIALADGSEEPGALIEQADAAMYRSKELGRARYEFFSDALRERIAHRLELESALRHAIARGELRLHYQPEVDLHTGAIVGVEALLRWQRPEALVTPGEFIGLAEDTGLIVPIGTWVLTEALRQLAAWENDAAIATSPWMSVNLSVRQLSDPELIPRVTAALEHRCADPARLLLEVTESVVLDDAEAGLSVLTALRCLGTEIGIDDFGTGYASLSYLRRFPASVVKVDRSFIAELGNDHRARAIVEAIVTMSRSLGLKIVAEGIETAQQLRIVRELGFDIGQGYLFARPGSAADIGRLLGNATAFGSLLGPVARDETESAHSRAALAR
ncbi:bifunctional diguanylate cyclase/phosphodiesterase [Conexibacter sp. DBS9H8]|uniref:putative bifunctional diguanylate cyclase/phosphodiesterase n=1 Tax=Conexibacter sp. DBS9H8 TaxID=2937801 RepID=UPI00200D7050|nr:EAL domain-containing protein [Conexibacter sp. DBS9H8]